LGESTVEFTIPLGMRTQADRQSIDSHGNDSTQRIAILSNTINESRYLGIALGMERINRTSIAKRA
jgi:hypothetical protein